MINIVRDTEKEVNHFHKNLVNKHKNTTDGNIHVYN